MKWHEPLFVGEAAEKKKNRIMRKFEKEIPPLGVFVITLASNGRDLLDILPGYMLFRDDLREREILGLAVTKQEAFEVCEQIIMSVYRETGDFAVRSYFS